MLVTAKPRVASLKTKSLRRLGLSETHLLSKLWPMLSRHIFGQCSGHSPKSYRIKTHLSTLQAIVARGVEIQELTDKVR